MMHQSIENRPCLLVSVIQAIVASLDLIQATILLQRFGNYDEDTFFIIGAKPTDPIYESSLKTLCRSPSNAFKPLTSILVLFEGGPTGDAQFKASLAAFIADRLLGCLRIHGRGKVCAEIDDIVKWKQGAPWEDDIEDDTWDEVAAFERYAG
jgi:hypothetical protein